jgi:preprotein translocase subunit SecA
VQRGHHYAIVDEVDSILIDEARTPLIISGPSEESTDKYYKVNKIIPYLKRGEVIDGKEPGIKYTTGDFTVDEKHRGVALTEEGVLRCEKLLSVPNLYDPQYVELNHHVQQALKAHVIFQRDKDYVVKDGQVIIVDEFTGRLMPGRRWSDGLHQAVEAKENVRIERENQTLATITFQNYFRMYKKLSGMTGTAETEAAEFQKIYNLDVTVIPTNKPLLRVENADVVYRTEEEKFRNAAKEIKEFQQRGQPVLVGTISVEKSEKLASLLKKNGVPHEVLNAKNHSREALIVAQAGRKGAVTVSTNMAGRGTDILLGGNAEFMTKELFRKQGKNPDLYQTAAVGSPERAEWDEVFLKHKAQTDTAHDEVVALGGLHIVGTERHESRRIDNQLRGRAGRQGDPGSSRFYLSLQDDLLRIFGGERMQNLMLKLGMEEDVPIESKLITRRIAAAQKAVEVQHFEARKHLLEYDDVMNKQRQAVYGMRRALLEKQEQKERVVEMAEGIVGSFIDMRCPENEHPQNWDFTALKTDLLTQFGVKVEPSEFLGMSRQEVEDHVNDRVKKNYQDKEDMVGPEVMREAERMVMLNVIDEQWKDHLLSMDHLKEGINLRGYGQKDPLVEYKKESYILFQELMDRIEDETVRFLFFMRFEQNRPALPFDTEDDMSNGDDDEEEARERAEWEAAERARKAEEEKAAAQRMLSDMTRKIEKKKDKQMADLQFVGGDGTASATKTVVKGKKVGRNEPCPCGSGKKYKQCHGA